MYQYSSTAGLELPCADRFLSALTFARDGIFIFDAATLRFLFVNEGAAEQTGYSREELLGLTIVDIESGFSDDAWGSMLGGLCETTGETACDSTRYATVHLRKDGSALPVEVMLQCIASSPETPKVFLAVTRDITERKQTEASLVEANQRSIRQYDRLLQRLSALAQASGSARDLTTVLRAIRDFARASVPCSALLISLYDEQKSQRTIVYLWYNGGEMDVSILQPVPVGRGPVGLTISQGDVMTFGDYQKWKIPASVAVGFSEDPRDPRSILIAPMMLKGRVTGVIEVQSYDIDAFTEEHTIAMRMAANLAANAIENVRLLEQERVSTERNRISQKMESIGHLAAGVAHEINTPLQYVGDNNRFIGEAFSDLACLFGKYSDISARFESGADPAGLLSEIEVLNRQADSQYLLKEIPGAIEQSLEGIERVNRIVKSMRDFAHPGSTEMQSVNLNHSIESTITVARSEWKHVAEIETDFDENLPPVTCVASEINQVILNLIINATHAIADVLGTSGGKGKIKLSTAGRGEMVEIRVSDTGLGIPNEYKAKIFDPFFTTKKVGLGTGQGLAISHQVIVGKHGGNLSFETEFGTGTTFIIRIPINPEPGDADGAPDEVLAGGA
jgi:PAS domain S-box-containing protein